MNVTVYRKPCLLLETVELVYAYVNQVPEKKLTASGDFCIPPEEIHRLQTEVCAGLRCSEEELQFFFHGIPLQGETHRFPCIARALVYNSLELHCQSTEETRDALISYWQNLRRPLLVDCMDFYSVNFTPSKTEVFVPLSREIRKLPVPAEYHAELVDVFSNYESYLTRLAQILEPAAQKLELLLEPWVRRAQPLLDQWESFFSQDDSEMFFRNRVQLKVKKIDQLEMALRYIPAEQGYVRVYEPNGEIKMLFGVGMKVGNKEGSQKETLSDWEYTALRLLANPDRIAMLNAMLHEPMSGPALMQKLGLHSGSVFRDLNSMYNARLLIRETDEGKNVYRTNLQVIQKLSKHMLQAIDPDYLG